LVRLYKEVIQTLSFSFLSQQLMQQEGNWVLYQTLIS
jgi:hypothetical protein